MTSTSTVSNTARLLLTMHQRTAGLAEGLRKGIDPKSAASMPVIDGKVVNCNHATFVYGHLAIYPQKIMAVLGTEPGNAAVPGLYDELFEAGVECQDDPENKVYPAFDEIFEHFQRAHITVQSHIATLDDDTLSGAITGNERAAEFFGTRDSMAIFMLHDHYMFHLGQLSTWRRCMGLGSAM